MNENMKKVLEEVYDEEVNGSWFERDYMYLANAYSEIKCLWTEQFNKINLVRFVMLAEAPLWGDGKQYIYNERAPFSQFLYRSDLQPSVSQQIESKKDMIACLNDLGIIVTDILPFPLAPKKTALSYASKRGSDSKSITSANYEKLIEETFRYHLKPKLDKIKEKSINKDLKETIFFYRYARVMNYHSTLSKLFEETFNVCLDRCHISQRGGGVNKDAFANLLKETDGRN